MVARRLDAVLRLAQKALAAGARRNSISEVEWDVSGSCLAPVTREIIGRADTFSTKWVEVESRQIRSFTVLLHCRCRRCEACLRQRRNQWRDRAMAEVAVALRTWFVTFTFTPANHHRFTLLAARRLRSRGVDPSTVSEEEMFREQAAQAGAEITKYFKRLRKNGRVRVRYLLVCEEHSQVLDGLPHYHAFVHEGAGPRVTYRLLRGCWGYVGNSAVNAPGFLSAFLVKTEYARFYLTKYLNKNARTRVRCSSRYGSPPTDLSPRLSTYQEKPVSKDPPEQANNRAGPKPPACSVC